GDAPKDAQPTRSAIHLYVPNVDELFAQAVNAGATVVRPIVDQFYGDREASLDDPLGNRWYIASPVREGYRSITAVLHPRGTDKAIDFIRNAFGGELVDAYRTPEGT